MKDEKPTEQPAKRERGRPTGAMNYTQEQINEALILLFKNKGDVKNTAKQLGIDGKTLRIWRNRQMLEAIQERRMTEIAKDENDLSIGEKRENYERKAIDAKTVILEQIIALVPSYKTPAVLTRALRAIHESIATDKAPVPPTGLPVHPGGGILGMIVNQIENNTNGPKDNRTGGDSEKPAG